MARKKSNLQDRYLVRMQGGNRGLVEATSRMDIHEFRVFMTMLTMVLPEDKDFEEYEIRTQDVIKLFSLGDDGRYYEAVREAADRLFNKKFVILETKADGQVYKTTIHLIDETSEPVKESEQNRIIVKFNPKLKPYLIQLQREYLTIDIRNVKNVQSPYSMKLYFILKHQYNLGNRKKSYTVERLREILAIEKHEYPMYGNFKQKILKKGMLDLEKNTDLKIVRLEELKNGRAVESVVFHIEGKESTKISKTRTSKKSELDSSSGEEKEEDFQEFEVVQQQEKHDNLLQEIHQPIRQYVSETTVSHWIEHYSVEQIRRGVAYALQQVERGKVKNVGAYLQKMVAIPDLVETKAESTKPSHKQSAKSRSVSGPNAATQEPDLSRAEAHRQKVSRFEELIEENQQATVVILEHLKRGLFGSYYKDHLSLTENMADPALSGILVDIAASLFPKFFENLPHIED
ncbi:replication initiation protein [Arundinibacter roseus]|uniref:RepB family plasmid replication initiator protein n=1 Tax=Arundinibacter roseus TaxID=2070510 RepID=A0A4R4K0P0_9BACT|nr:replication initiation protein [Arundinibacter roseus]TDB59529.1 RepB family plasmid replication initiator protein [Arundinibacter roseus]